MQCSRTLGGQRAKRGARAHPYLRNSDYDSPLRGSIPSLTVFSRPEFGGFFPDEETPALRASPQGRQEVRPRYTPACCLDVPVPLHHVVQPHPLCSAAAQVSSFVVASPPPPVLHTSLQGGTDGPARQERRRDGGTTTPTSSPQNCLPLTVPHRFLYQSHCPSLLPSFTSRLTSRRRCALSLDRTRETGIYICCRSTSSASSSSRSWRARLASPQPLQSRRRYTRPPPSSPSRPVHQLAPGVCGPLMRSHHQHRAVATGGLTTESGRGFALVGLPVIIATDSGGPHPKRLKGEPGTAARPTPCKLTIRVTPSIRVIPPTHVPPC